MSSRTVPWPRVAAGLTAAFLLVGIGVGIASPSLFRRLLAEDGWGEWATFAAFATAAVLGAHRALERAATSRAGLSTLERLGAAGVAAFCAFVAGEEISWGQRIVGFTPPEVFLERNYQQEANLHNLLKDIFDSRWQVVVIAIGYGVLAPLLGPRIRLLSALAPARLLAPGFAAVALLEIAYPFDLAGELAELALGISFLLDVSLRREPAEHDAAGARRGVLLVAGALGVAGLLGPVVERVTRGSAPDDASRAASELELLAADVARAGVARPKLFAKQRVHKRVFTAVRERYLQLGTTSTFLEGRATPAEEQAADRRDRRGYFLDPWGQPYWILAQPSSGAGRSALVYSFGPNRKRDSDLGEAAGPAAADSPLRGDDVGVLVDLRR